MRGAWSDVLPAPLTAEMLARQPRARLVTVPGVGHLIPFLRPHALAHLIQDFLSAPDATEGHEVPRAASR